MIRIIATLLYDATHCLVKGKSFDAWRRVGSVIQAVNVMQMRSIDEIILLDITATKEGRRPDFDFVREISRECFVPLTVGGGVHSVEDMDRLLQAGADRVSARSGIYDIAEPAGERFGRQAIVGCWDHESATDVWIDSEWATGWHVGEMLLQSVPRDGTLTGYDLQLYRNASGYDCPVIASGGAGTYEHFYQAIQAGASAVAAGAMWLFTEQTPLEAKRYLQDRGVPVRL